MFLTCLQLVGTWVQNIFRNSVPGFLTCPQLWVYGCNIFSGIWCQIFGVSCSKCCVSCHVCVSCRVLIVLCHPMSAFCFEKQPLGLFEKIWKICPSSAESQEYMLFFCLPLSSCSTSAHNDRRAPRCGAIPRAHPCCCVLRRLSLGWLFNGKQKINTYSWQRMGIYFWHVFN